MAAGAAVASGYSFNDPTASAQAGQSLAQAEHANRRVAAEPKLLSSSPVRPVAQSVPSAGDARAVAATPESETQVADVASLTKAVKVGEKMAEKARRDSEAKDQESRRQARSAQGVKAVSRAKPSFVKPTVGRVTSNFGPRGGTRHNGVDIANKIGTPIRAVTDGVVVESGPASGFGLWVRVRHDDGFTSVYGHINRSLVRAGQRVSAGQQIAEIGNRGQSTGPHLHLEIWDPKNRKINVNQWLAERGISPGG